LQKPSFSTTSAKCLSAEGGLRGLLTAAPTSPIFERCFGHFRFFPGHTGWAWDSAAADTFPEFAARLLGDVGISLLRRWVVLGGRLPLNFFPALQRPYGSRGGTFFEIFCPKMHFFDFEIFFLEIGSKNFRFFFGKGAPDGALPPQDGGIPEKLSVWQRKLFSKSPFFGKRVGTGRPLFGRPPGLEGTFFRGVFGAQQHRGMVPFQNPCLARLHLERGTFGKDFSERDFFRDNYRKVPILGHIDLLENWSHKVF
jgi:hypothetical protein